MAFPLTEEQRKIVDDRGGELLVSAAAGSGKTRVLVERLLDRVTEEGLDIDRFLVITFTKAAAAELRSRIAQELAVRLAEKPNDRHLRKQTALVYRAQISTIHAFCSVLLRENGHLLDLDADFRLMDESEAQVMMVRVLEQLLDQRYEGLKPESPFAQLVDTMAAGRDDSRLSQIVLDIYGRVQSHPDPVSWLKEQQKEWKLDQITDLAESSWGAYLLAHAKRQAEWCNQQLIQLKALADRDELLQMNYLPSLMASQCGVAEFLAASTWDEAAACLPVPFPAVGRKRKRQIPVLPEQEAASALTAENVKSMRNRCKKILEKIAEEMGESSAALLEELKLSEPAVNALMDLVQDFHKGYIEEKRHRNVVDFSDLEHFSVQLLTNPEGEPTQLAQHWSCRFAEVMVDEYQDTNQVQNVIFNAVSDGGKKLFLVGDVKQSIYRFRLADPTIFLRKYREFVSGDDAKAGQPRKRILSCNFRSRPQVLEGCNDLFRAIMSREFGEMDYTDDQALVPGAKFPEGEDYALELDALDLSFLGDRDGEKENKDLLEARFVARRITELLTAPFMVTEGEGQRPLRPSDVMILLRSPGSVLHHYIRALGEEGIPWVADGGVDYFATTEVNVALSILQIVDNPRQDVPLIAALRSPVYGFSGDKLALLRARSQGDFYSVLVHAAQEGDEDCVRFLEELEQLRFGAGDRTCRQLIWHIYEQTNLLGIFGAMDGGGERQSNLLSLYALAGQLEESGCRSLFQFLLRLERMRASNTKLTSATGNEGEGVSILSIHRSKGLEKPVVLVCGLTRRLNREDLKGTVLFHPRLGIGPKGLDCDRMVEYPTLARRAVARQLEQEMMAEELRLLYVAMTRAREKLILSLALTEGDHALELMQEDFSVPISVTSLERQSSVGQWILLHAVTRPEATLLRMKAGIGDLTAEGLGPKWDIRWVDGTALEHPHRKNGRYVDVSGQEEEQDQKILEKLGWSYSHLACANIPSKLTATQVKGRPLDREAAEDAQPTEPATEAYRPIYRPNFIVEERGLTAAQRGSALHLAMQHIPLDADHSIEGIREEIERLTQQEYLTPLQAKAIDPARISAFFTSPMGQRLKSAALCQREFKFSLLIPAREYYPEAGDESILMQGVVDAWFEEEDGVSVLDFKSDKVSPGGETVRAEEHRPQLEAYAKALEAILGRPVKRKLLWFFATDTVVEL